MDCSLPGSSVHGILQARILAWVAISSSSGSSQPRDWTQASSLQADSLPSEPPWKPCTLVISPIELPSLFWIYHSLFLLFLFAYFNWRLITLQYCGGFCHTLTWINHGCTCVPHHEFPLLLSSPSHSFPQGCPSVPALSALFHASNLDWWSVSHMVIYLFQCCSRKSSHPRFLPQSPKVWSFYLCLFCCLTYRGIVTIFLNCIYMH